MSRKTHVSLNEDFVEAKFGNLVKQASDLISPQNFALIGGRGSTKTTTFVAERAMDICYDMPGAYMAFVADTYVNAMKNIVPTLLDGWNKAGWREGIHYVTDERPPSHFKLPYKPPMSYKHTLSIFNGCFYNIGSLDQPSGLAGNSYQHLFLDEARTAKFEKYKRITPALRGEIDRFGHSVYYGGRTITTDIPNVLSGDEDWIWEMQKEMDQEQAKLALQIGLVLNEVTKELINYQKAGDIANIKRLKKQMLQWKERWIRARKGLTFFYVVSSYISADILGEGFFANSLSALGLEEFKSAILSFKTELKKGEKFYSHLGDHHFYNDGIYTGYYDKYKIGDEIEESSLALKYIDHNAKLEIGVDFGNMCSVVSGQPRGNYYYALKGFHTLAPQSEKELAAQIRNFYKHHNKKEIDMYYDRSGNQNKKIKKDRASELKHYLEYENGVKKWNVKLMNETQGNIEQEEEFNFMRQFMGEMHKELPKLKIDVFSCKFLKSSLELAKMIMKINSKGEKGIYKDKTSEKLAIHLLPMFSTNYSDALKYLLCRPNYLKYYKKKGVSFTGSDPGVF